MPDPKQRRYDTIVLGAGAAGMLCAAEAGKGGLRVLLLEHGERPGRKILISGGGRCNFTNLHCAPANFLSQNPHFSKSALARYTPQDFLRLVERYRIPYHHKTLGQLFCDGSAQAIVQMLEAECREGNVELRLRTPVLRVERTTDGFTTHTPAGPLISKTIVVATGGLSIPKMGATGIGYEIARSFSLRIVEPRPALVPLTFHDIDRGTWADLSGLSTEVIATLASAAAAAKGHRSGENLASESPVSENVTLGNVAADRLTVERRTAGHQAAAQRTTRRQAPSPAFREKLLITHRGLSGPAVLQISSYWHPGETIRFDLVPGASVFTPMLRATAQRDDNAAYSLLRERLPQRMAERWLQTNLPSDWKNAAIERLEAALHTWQINPGGDEGFSKAEVTSGGVSTSNLDSTTMQSKQVPGLAFIGEVVDVTGHLGGHNFQWAWASAVAAARSL